VLEAQRADLGDSVVDAALIPLREKPARLSSGDGSSSAAGERRLVTILFCDVVGSTTLAEQMDPEVWTRIMNAVFERLNEPVDRYGGTVARLLGDAVLAFFGAPVSHENDAERAVLAGLTILENVTALRKQLKKENGIDFNVRIGINTGLVVAGQVGSAVHGEYTAMGDVANLAARMEQTAAPGTLQISGDTYRAVAPLFEVEMLGPITVKGKSKPVPAYRVLGRKVEPGKLRGLEASGLISPLVGRDAELAVLERAVDDLRGRDEGAVVLIFGEAGLGKSTLAGEARRRTAGENVRWLEGHTLSIGQSLSYWPFREILWQVAGISEEDDEESAWQKLENSVIRLFADQTADILPYLASLLALEVHEAYREKVAYLDAEALGRQVYLAARRFFERLAVDQPLILLFEDLHWMDDASARLLEHLLPLIERAGGNPFFLEEIIRTLIDSGAIAYESRNGRWRATKTIETLQLPDTVQGVIIARVDRLAEDVKQVLRTTAVVGRSFLYRLLREVMKVDYELEGELATLQESDLIREKQRQPELEYIFKHALAQEAVLRKHSIRKAPPAALQRG
jgi:class 3 adenylate cyclase